MVRPAARTTTESSPSARPIRLRQVMVCVSRDYVGPVMCAGPGRAVPGDSGGRPQGQGFVGAGTARVVRAGRQRAPTGVMARNTNAISWWVMKLNGEFFLVVDPVTCHFWSLLKTALTRARP